MISPLISLMKDQLDKLVELGIPAVCINSTISPAEQSGIFDDLRNPETKIKFLYIAPERLNS